MTLAILDSHIRLHEIVDDYDKNHPVCLDWEGEAPPEDVGGGGMDMLSC